MKKITLFITLITTLSFSQTTINFDAADFADGTGGIGFMNVFEHPQDGSVGAFVFGSGWGIPDLVSVVTASTVELKPNRINDSDPFWQTGNLEGNKLMEANHFFESNTTLGGDILTFTGNVLSNTLETSTFNFPIQSVAFIKVLDQNTFATLASATTPLPATGSDFSVTLDVTAFNNGEIIQYGFQLFGPNVNIDSAFDAQYDDLGSITIQPRVLSTLEVSEVSFGISPNPTNNVWNIETNSTIDSVEVFDLLGKQVLEVTPNNQNASVDASNLKTGIYLARITANNVTKTIKLVKN